MSKPLVVDAGFVFKLVVLGPYQSHYQTLATQWLRDGYTLCAPTLWLYEITSALCKTVHFGQLSLAEGKSALILIHRLEIQIFPPDETQTQRAFTWTTRLKRAAAYDSFYLALAETLNCELWTTDKRLYNAVGLPWVRWGGSPEQVTT